MKKLFIVLFCLISIASKAQTDYYTAYKAALYEKTSSGWTQSWVNDDLSIPLAFTKNTVQISAKSATTFRLDNTLSREFQNNDVEGISYPSYEIVNGRKCRVDIVHYRQSGVNVFSVTYEDVYPNQNLRYYITKD